jgi:hypothetical protein
MQISSLRAPEESNGVTGNFGERVVEVNCWTIFAEDCNFNVYI